MKSELLFVNMFQNDNCYLSTHLQNSLPRGSRNICGGKYETEVTEFCPLLKNLKIEHETCRLSDLPEIGTDDTDPRHIIME